MYSSLELHAKSSFGIAYRTTNAQFMKIVRKVFFRYLLNKKRMVVHENCVQSALLVCLKKTNECTVSENFGQSTILDIF